MSALKKQKLQNRAIVYLFLQVVYHLAQHHSARGYSFEIVNQNKEEYEDLREEYDFIYIKRLSHNALWHL